MQERHGLPLRSFSSGKALTAGRAARPEVAQERRYLQGARWGWSCRDESPCATRIAPGNGSSRRRPRKRSRRRTGWRRSWYCWDATATKRSPWAFPSRSRFAGGRRPRCCVPPTGRWSRPPNVARGWRKNSMTPGGSYPPTARSAPPWPGAARSRCWRRGRRRAARLAGPGAGGGRQRRPGSARSPVRRIAAYRRPSRAPGARPGRRPGLRRPAALAGRRRRAPFAGPAQRAPAAPSRGVLHHLFEAQARRTPQRIAVHAADRSLSYAELERESAALAVRLRAAGGLRSSGSGSACGATAACWSACLACSAPAVATSRWTRPIRRSGWPTCSTTPTACWCWSTRAPASGSPRWAGHA